MDLRLFQKIAPEARCHINDFIITAEYLKKIRENVLKERDEDIALELLVYHLRSAKNEHWNYICDDIFFY